MTPQTVQPQVHPHLLAELPRFFGGPTQVLREFLQTALRAGASAVTVTQNGEWLTVSDNGCGCADPQLLLTVAQSGWKDVTDPAGMGVLSILNPDLIQSVTFRSRDWTFTQGGTHVALPCRERALQQVGETFSPRLGSLLEVRRVSPPSGIAQGDTVRLAAPGHPRLVAQVTFVQALPQGALPQDVPHAPSSTALLAALEA
jgi:hypothetical protein